MSYIDFDTLKKAVGFEQVMNLLGLTMKKQGNQWRGQCPVCKTGGPRSLVITEHRGFYCFAAGGGGDIISLVAHIKELQPKDAAKFIADNLLTPSRPESASAPPSGQQGTRTLQPLAYLEAAHPAVEAVGFDEEFAKTHGIGFAPKGVARGHVLIPFRDEKGVLLGYVGLQESCWLPPEFRGEIKKSA